MNDLGGLEQVELARLRRRLERERCARQEAEAIAEKALRELFAKQQALTEEIQQRERVEKQYHAAQKMEAIGRLAGGVAHDFNNLLTVILGCSEILQRNLGPKSQGWELAEQIAKAGDRAAALTRQLLAFSRRQVLSPLVLDLNAVVSEVEALLRRVIGADIQFTIVVEPGLPAVKADRGQLEQVLMNLIVNARDAMPRGGKLTIETKNVLLDEGFAQARHEIQPGRYALLAVSDTGCGMDEPTKARIFEPFFTTKEPGKGTGLGLATAYGIVKQSGGYIYVYSEPGLGTTFKLYFPQTTEALAAAPVRSPLSDEDLQGTETVLLAEDDARVRTLACRVLQAKGYTVLAAGNAEEARACSENHPGPIHLLLTDIIMPGMNGRELSEHLVSQRASLEVLFVSGYAEDAIVQHGVLASGLAFLPKPYTPDGLLRKVREVLAKSSFKKKN